MCVIVSFSCNFTVVGTAIKSVVGRLSISSIPVGFAIGEAMVNVLTVGPRMGKPFEAFRTLEWLLAGVQPFVFGQVMLVLESLVTFRTLVGTLV